MSARVWSLALVAAATLAPGAPQGTAPRNPSYLRASELLRAAEPGVAPRIRFEWERVPGSTEYVLSGQWTEAPSWALRSREYRVTERNATSWAGERVTFDVSLPPGSHSWNIVAVFGAGDAGDFQNPAHLSFTVK